MRGKPLNPTLFSSYRSKIGLLNGGEKNYERDILRRKLTVQINKSKLSFLRAKLPVFIAIIVLALIGVAAVAFNRSGSKDGSASDMPSFTVKQGPLKISITESGTIQAREQIIIKSEVEGRATILSLVEEGTNVKQGELLVELDASRLLDEKVDQQIRVQNAEASFIRARENLAVAKNQAQSDVDKAELTLDFARQDLKKYLEGEYQNQCKEMEARITLAQQELRVAEEELKWSRILFEKEYISQTELQADELSANKRKLDLELAENNLRLLEDFTYPRKLAELESDVKQAEMALERTIRKAKADVIQAEAELRAKDSEFKRQRDKLTKLEEQIEKAKIYAPADGLVIYATSARSRHWRSNDEPLGEGREVHEREELIYLPTASAVKAEVKIHEASLEKVSVGMPVRVTVDALAGRTFTGSVAKIAPLPDAQMVWLNPDLKVYNTEIYLEGDGNYLRTGMSCSAEIIVEEYNNAIYVPIQAVLRVGGEPTAYVLNEKGFEPRKVEIGLDNNRMIRVISGLQAGEKVLLAPPLAAAAVEQAAATATAERIPGEEEIYQQGPAGQDSGADKAERRRRDRRDAESFDPKNLTSEQRQKMQERSEKMTPEEREKIRQQRRQRQQQSRENK